MPEPVMDEDLRDRGLGVLEKELGAVLTLRFLAMISRQSFDYQAWREEHFADISLDEILSSGSHRSRGS